MARKILAIPASQTSSERVFSTAANIVTKKRARLTARNVNVLTFLRHNADLVDWEAHVPKKGGEEQLVEDSSEGDDGNGSDDTSVSTSDSDIVEI